jgi:hypothetical protein
MICSAYTAWPIKNWRGSFFLQSIRLLMRWKALRAAMGKKRQVCGGALVVWGRRKSR